jgi:F-type H+-transporting ATPase subunit epsilon
MSMKIHVDIVSAEGQLFNGSGDMVYVPAMMGEVGIAPRHTPFISQMKPGDVRIENEGKQEHFYVSGGMLEVQPHMITILADTAVRAHDLDEAAVIEAKRRAEDALENQKSDFEYAKAKAELAEAVAQLRTIQRIRSGSKSS